MADSRDDLEPKNGGEGDIFKEPQGVPAQIDCTIEKFDEISLEDNEIYGGESDDEMLEDDVDLWEGENPIELEVEKYCQPSKRTIMKELSNLSNKKNLIVYPLSLPEMNHPIIQACIAKCSQFKTSYYASHKADQNFQENTWTGLMEFVFTSTFSMQEAVESLKTIREDIVVISSTSQDADLSKSISKWTEENSCRLNIKDMDILLAKNLSPDTDIQTLRNLMPTCSEIIIIPSAPLSNNSKEENSNNVKKSALVFFPSSDLLQEVLKQHEITPLKIGNPENRLKLFAYLPPQLPTGLLKMDRRYKEIVNLRELRKIYKDKVATLSSDQKKKLIESIKRCLNFLERDNKARTELSLPLHTWKELRKIKVVRDSIPAGTQWFPLLSSSPKGEEKDEASNGSKTKKRRRDHRKSNKAGHSGRPFHFADNFKSFGPGQGAWKTGSYQNQGFAKNSWFPPSNFGAFNVNPMSQVQEMAAMMHQMSCNPSLLGNFYNFNRFGDMAANCHPGGLPYWNQSRAGGLQSRQTRFGHNNMRFEPRSFRPRGLY